MPRGAPQTLAPHAPGVHLRADGRALHAQVCINLPAARWLPSMATPTPWFAARDRAAHESSHRRPNLGNAAAPVPHIAERTVPSGTVHLRVGLVGSGSCPPTHTPRTITPAAAIVRGAPLRAQARERSTVRWSATPDESCLL
jgi:hypothetical protein